MSQTSADAAAAAAVESQAAAPGAMLARRRAAVGMALADVANRLKFAPRQIEALEADDYTKLPGMTFVRGMIRSYAKLLELDPGPMMQALDRLHAPEPVSVEMHSESIPFPDGRTSSTRVYLFLSALLVLAVGAILYEWHFGMPQIIASSQGPGEVLRATPAETPAETATPAAAADAASSASAPAAAYARNAAAPESSNPAAPESSNPAASEARIEFDFQETSWVEVRDRAGKILTSQLNPGGSRRIIAGDPPFALVIGNASHVRMSYKDEPIDLKPYVKIDVARLTLD